MTVRGVALDPDVAGSLIERAISGDETAFARIVAAHHDDMTRIAHVVCGDPELAADAVQAAWAIAWRRLDTIREPDRLRAWLMAVAANEARQTARSARRRQVRELAVGGPGSAASVDRADVVDLSNALGRLDPRDRALIALRFISGFDSEAIAQAVGMSPSGARSRLSRIVARLRRELSDG